jgi:hypothetical protein
MLTLLCYYHTAALTVRSTYVEARAFAHWLTRARLPIAAYSTGQAAAVMAGSARNKVLWPLLGLLAFALGHAYLCIKLLHLLSPEHSGTRSEGHRHLQAGSYSHQVTRKLGTAAMIILDMLIAAVITLLTTALAWSLYKAAECFKIPSPSNSPGSDPPVDGGNTPEVVGSASVVSFAVPDSTSGCVPAATTGATPVNLI